MRKYSKFLSKIARSGFYIVLFLCISAIGISGYVIYSVNKSAKEVKETFDADSYELPFPEKEEAMYDFGKALTFTENESETEKTVEEKPQEVAKPVIKEEKETAEKETAATVTPSQEKTIYVMATAGAVMKPYSNNELVKSETMDDWRVHSGVDIKAEIGADVKAIADGKVTAVKKDEMLGNTITIEHKGGLVSIYANLSDEISVKEGEAIKGGAVVAKVGNSALCECLEEPHLHLEVLKENKHIDPLSLYPEGKE